MKEKTKTFLLILYIIAIGIVLFFSVLKFIKVNKEMKNIERKTIELNQEIEFIDKLLKESNNE